MKKALVTLVLAAVMAFGAGSASAAELEPIKSYGIVSDPGGGGGR
ncbi:hypothetical protein P4V41_07520 [Fictibacillus nanhaiensis]|nr:hypothetical protein [Fictibacillus nanhaiensis]